MGLGVRYEVSDVARIGDHICYISDLRKVREHFPGWQITYDLRGIVFDIVDNALQQQNASLSHS